MYTCIQTWRIFTFNKDKINLTHHTTVNDILHVFTTRRICWCCWISCVHDTQFFLVTFVCPIADNFCQEIVEFISDYFCFFIQVCLYTCHSGHWWSCTTNETFFKLYSQSLLPINSCFCYLSVKWSQSNSMTGNSSNHFDKQVKLPESMTPLKFSINTTLKFSKTRRFATPFLQRNYALCAPLNMYETSIWFDQCICDYL